MLKILVGEIKDNQAHEEALKLADEVMGIINDDPNHCLSGFLDAIADAIQKYEDELYGVIN